MSENLGTSWTTKYNVDRDGRKAIMDMYNYMGKRGFTAVAKAVNEGMTRDNLIATLAFIVGVGGYPVHEFYDRYNPESKKDKPSQKKKNKPFYFTFGFGHWQEGRDLTNHYTVIYAENEDDARHVMVNRRESRWCTSYTTIDPVGVEKYGAKYIPFSQVKEQPGPTK